MPRKWYSARSWTGPPVKGDFGVIDRPALEAANLTVTATPQPSIVGDRGFTSCRIDAKSFAKLESPSAMRYGMSQAPAAALRARRRRIARKV